MDRCFSISSCGRRTGNSWIGRRGSAMPHPLVIGYGNPLREDDAVGLRAAELVDSGAYRCHQLTPELASVVADASMVIFLDAARCEKPGEIRFSAVHPEP